MSSEQLSLKELTPPDYSDEEKERVIEYFMSLKGDLIRQFLTARKLPKTGTKPQLRELILGYLEEGKLAYADLVTFLDAVAPWGKQHVFLLNGPESAVKDWREKKFVTDVLGRNRLSRYLNAHLPLILPPKLSLSSIEHKAGQELRLLAVERREHWERNREFDEKKKPKAGKEIELRAYLHEVTRGIVVLRWNLVANQAILQISQLPSGSRYEDVEERFSKLIGSFLDLATFTKLDLRPVVGRLQELEESGHPEARSHNLEYRTVGGRKVSAESPSYQDSVLGEQELDSHLRDIRTLGPGYLGNFYWLPGVRPSSNTNPLEKEVHTIVVANKGRINFTTPNRREDMEYVLSRVRELSK